VAVSGFGGFGVLAKLGSALREESVRLRPRRDAGLRRPAIGLTHVTALIRL
jgi:hypothetical protein